MKFLSTPSARRATVRFGRFHRHADHFYPRPPRGGRLYVGPSILGYIQKFLSTPSARRATAHAAVRIDRLLRFLSTPSARRATNTIRLDTLLDQISIHALREEGDSCAKAHGADGKNFYPRPPRGGRRLRHISPTQTHAISIHALREEGDISYPSFLDNSFIFLSTPSARRATCLTVLVQHGFEISIHALREEGDVL